MEGSFFKKKDIFIIALLLVFAAAFYFFNLPGSEGTTAEVSVDGQVVKKVSLSGKDDGIHQVEGMNIRYEVKDGKIGFIYSDCPDKVCINDGFISLGGQRVVCLPNKAVIMIPRDEKDDSGIDIMLH